MATPATLAAMFPNAENDLRKRITQVVEGRVKPLRSAVPLAISCFPVSNGYRVRVSSRWLPDQSIEATLSESSLRNLDGEWQKFCNVVAEAFAKGPLRIS